MRYREEKDLVFHLNYSGHKSKDVKTSRHDEPIRPCNDYYRQLDKFKRTSPLCRRVRTNYKMLSLSYIRFPLDSFKVFFVFREGKYTSDQNPTNSLHLDLQLKGLIKWRQCCEQGLPTINVC
jgi:hypothetical protein